MRNREIKLEAIRRYLVVLYKELPIEYILEGNFLIHLEFFITCLDYDLKPTKEELEQLRKDIIKNISEKMEQYNE